MIDSKELKPPGFMLYLHLTPMFDYCTDEQAGKLIKACFHYAMGGTYTDYLVKKDPDTGNDVIDELLNGYFAVLKNELDRDRERYREISAKRAAAGEKGGKAKANNTRRNAGTKKFYE